MSRIIMVTADPMPSPRANGVQTAHTAAALAALGHEVTLLATAPTSKQQSIYDAYGVPPNFKIQYLPAWNPPSNFSNRKRLKSLSFLPGLLFTLLNLRRQGSFHIYSREDHFTGYLFLLLKKIIGIAIFFESHYFPPTKRNLSWQAKMDGIITINNPLKQAYIQAGVSENQIGVAPDGVDVQKFLPQLNQPAAKKALGFNAEKPLIIYTGHLFAWKGVFVLAEAMRNLPEAHCLIVGGLTKDQAELKRFIAEQEIGNVTLLGQVSSTAVPHYLWAADVLVLPNSGKKEISRLYTSPLKLFEYMAACRPIVASDLPSIRDVLTHGKNAHLVPADNPKAVAEGLRQIISNQSYGTTLAENAQKDVANYSWEKRAERIVAFMEHQA